MAFLKRDDVGLEADQLAGDRGEPRIGASGDVERDEPQLARAGSGEPAAPAQGEPHHRAHHDERGEGGRDEEPGLDGQGGEEEREGGEQQGPAGSEQQHSSRPPAIAQDPEKQGGGDGRPEIAETEDGEDADQASRDLEEGETKAPETGGSGNRDGASATAAKSASGVGGIGIVALAAGAAEWSGKPRRRVDPNPKRRKDAGGAGPGASYLWEGMGRDH